LNRLKIVFFIYSLLLFCACKKESHSLKVRLGYFPNITHAQALVGVSQNIFQKHLGQVLLETKVFNAGPQAIEALFAGALDVVYVGPNPAINAYVKSNGAFKIISGSCLGGASLVVRNDAGIAGAGDFNGKRIATPQAGNTQDIAARIWLRNNRLKLREKGGTVHLLPIANSDQLTLFLKKELDAAWTVAPWTHRLIQEANGKIFMKEENLWKDLTGGQYATVVILASDQFVKAHPKIIKNLLQAHMETTDFLKSNSKEAKELVNQELKKLTGKSLAPEVFENSFKEIEFTLDPLKVSIQKQAQWSFQEGFLGKKEPELSTLFDLSILNECLKEKGKGLVN